MKKYLEMIEEMEFSTREYVLMGACCFLTGLVLGVFISPKGRRTIGSNNGCNNSAQYYGKDMKAENGACSLKKK